MDVKIAIANSTKLFVKWSGLDCEDKNGDVLGYIIRYNTSSEDHTVVVEDKEQYNATLTNLYTLTNYTISVAAFNVNGTGPFSPSIAKTTGMCVHVVN